MRIIIGLGNPGDKYKNTRHNVGFLAVDALADSLNLSWQTNKKFNAEIAKDSDIILVKPLTYMNNSGQTVQAVMAYYKLLPKKLCLIKEKNSDLTKTLTVIHDDLDIELGKTKTATNSGSAGHNGVQSIINHLKTKNFTRIRIGIRTNILEKMPADKFVLQNFSKSELEIVNKIIDEVEV